MNTLKTGLLLVLMTALIMAIGGAFGGIRGVVFAFIIAVFMNVGSYWFCDKIVLSMYSARPVSESEAPELYAIINRLRASAGIPMPRLYVVPTPSPNAFATGRDPNHAAVAVTDGLLRILDRNEIEGVLAHEMAHIKNRDILISTIAATLAGSIMMIAQMARFAMIFGGGGSRRNNDGLLGILATIILAPIAAIFIQMAISRSREYQADATGASITGKPMDLANALLRLDMASKQIPAEVNPSTAHMLIVNPLRGGIGSLFSTHPPIPDRIEALKVIAIHNGQIDKIYNS